MLIDGELIKKVSEVRSDEEGQSELTFYSMGGDICKFHGTLRYKGWSGVCV